MIDCSKCPDRGCCCGVFMMSKELVNKHRDKFQVKQFQVLEDKDSITIVTDDLGCIFLNRKTRRCEIYEDRPEICRLYGMSKDKKLQCAYFKPSGNPRSEASKKQVLKYIDKMNKEVMNEIQGKGIKLISPPRGN